MELKVEPLKFEELDEMIRIYWEAAEQLEANMITPMIYPNGLTPELMVRIQQGILENTNGDIQSHCFCARSVETGVIIGASMWTLEEHPPTTKDGIDAKYEEASKRRHEAPLIEGMNSELLRASHKTMFYAEQDLVKGQPYMSLRLLVVRPQLHRRGAGSLLLSHGLEKADSLGFPVFLASAVSGKPLYKRSGFEEKGEMQLDCRDYGGRSDGQHWYMWRPAQKPPKT